MASEQPEALGVPTHELDAVVSATRVVGGLIAESLATVDPPVTMPQWRVLVLASQGSCNISAVADDLGVHPSNATRICDRLVSAGLLAREKAAGDRRQVLLSLTPSGRQLYDSAMAYRRARIESAMTHLVPDERSALATSIATLASALEAEHPHANDR